MKNVIKLNEEQLRKVVAESVKRVLKENEEEFYPRNQQISDNVFDGLCTLFKSLTTQYQYSPDEIAAIIKQQINMYSPEMFVG